MPEDFRRALWLEGWEGQSIWGFDEGMDSYFAQLWRDEDSNDAPTVWLSGMAPRFTMPEQLFAAMVSATGAPALDVFTAMEADDLAPRTIAPPPGPDEVRAVQAELVRQGPDQHLRGMADALAWSRWELPTGPVTGQPTLAVPTPQQLDAERWAATAAVYQRDDQPQAYFSGAESALMWLRGQYQRPV